MILLRSPVMPVIVDESPTAAMQPLAGDASPRPRRRGRPRRHPRRDGVPCPECIGEALRHTTPSPRDERFQDLSQPGGQAESFSTTRRSPGAEDADDPSAAPRDRRAPRDGQHHPPDSGASPGLLRDMTRSFWDEAAPRHHMGEVGFAASGSPGPGPGSPSTGRIRCNTECTRSSALRA